MGYLAMYLAVTVAGYFIGKQLKKKDIPLPWLSHVQTAVIMILVFFMGSRIGANEEIIRSLDTIGLVAFAYTLIIFAVTTAIFSLCRRLMGFDRYGVRRADRKKKGREQAAEQSTEQSIEQSTEQGAEQTGEATPVSADPSEEKPAEGNRVNGLTILIVICMAIGVVCGWKILPDAFIAHTGTLLTVTLCVLLVLIGIDIGTSGSLGQNFRSAGWRILAFPFINMGAMAVSSFIAALVLPLSVQDGLCIGSGFAWYSLAPVMLAEYSTRVSAISFMHNIFREVLGIILIPTVAKRVGYIECYCLPGSTSMDVCLPVIERSTSAEVAVYSFINGAILSASVPVLVSIFMSL